MPAIAIGLLLIGTYVSYRLLKPASKKPESKQKVKNKLSEFSKQDYEVLLTDAKYHLLKLILIRSEYH